VRACISIGVRSAATRNANFVSPTLFRLPRLKASGWRGGDPFMRRVAANHPRLALTFSPSVVLAGFLKWLAAHLAGA
jgi:hypothetical protein